MSEPNPRMQYPTDAAPAVGSAAIAVQEYSPRGRGLLITATGNITFLMEDGSEVDWPSIPVGIYALSCREITAATATGYVLR